ncbi:GntR family transcriptional regulator [Streptomyces sp. MUSC 14]|uniref:GntR family transcriptional regulator n=1 Tax=Streptomyces sp. MUSC 14 TaxID=1354889 RepID=UPI0008F5DB96|nr:GntR family transcriptional regulator [Streptomyces sp. MUSC 14]OIJ90596.1 GntR family transcriptional regulator [Streptomyces sp. MUSC 14]
MTGQGEALYLDMAGRLREAIADGQFPPGSRLPSEHVLAQEYGVSRNTVRRALEVLREDGLMSSQQGARRTVLALPRLQNFGELRSFSRWARSIGEVPSGRVDVLERRPADEEQAHELGLEPGDPVVYLVRVRLLTGVPVMIERTAYPERVGVLFSYVDLERESICERLEEHGIVFAHAEHAIDAVNADAEDARLLEVPPGTALLRERRRSTDHQGRPLEWSQDRYLGDAVAFTIRNSIAASPLVRDLPPAT